MRKNKEVNTGVKEQGVKDQEVKQDKKVNQEVSGKENKGGVKMEKEVKPEVKGQEVKEVSKEEQIKLVVMDEKASKSGKMKRLYDMGLGIKEIAVLLNVRYNFVYNVISNYCITQGVQLSHQTKDTKKSHILQLFDEGKTVKEVAITLKTNYQYVYKLHKEWSEKAAQEVKEMEQKEQDAKGGNQ